MKRTTLKTAVDIYQDFPGCKTVSSGIEPAITCTVTLPGGDTIHGIGSTLESAEDTAWHGARITLNS